MADTIRVRGVRVHNLKNINIDIPRDKLVVITGISGSGKSSLAFDTLYAEGERRYVESLSSYARQFLGVLDKPDVEHIDGLSPAIAIDQKSVSRNPRSTVGTITEIYDYLRLLFARIGKPYCPKCGVPIARQSPTQITDHVLAFPANREILILAPMIRDKKGEHQMVIDDIGRKGYLRVRVDGTVYPVEEAKQLSLARYKRHSVDAVVDRLVIDPGEPDRARIADSVETALKLGNGIVTISLPAEAGKKNGRETQFSEKFSCPNCGFSVPEIEPRTFSFNSPHGACSVCTGLGTRLEVDPELVIPNKKLSIGEGAVRPWASASHRVGRQGWYWWMFERLARRHHFSLDVPVAKLPRPIVDIILYGDKAGGFEGVIPNLERRWKETESEWTREEIERYMTEHNCPACNGKRLRPEALSVFLGASPNGHGLSIADITELAIQDAAAFFKSFHNGATASDEKPSLTHLSRAERTIAEPIVREVVKRLQFLLDVGLEYLTLARVSTTLSGGESQRIRLATQIGSQLVGVLYILDEPSIGLHQRDQNRLLATLCALRDLGNTVIVVEHDEQTIRTANWIVDIGPGAGEHGGEVIFTGPPRKLEKTHTLTGMYLSGKKSIEAPKEYRSGGREALIIKGAAEHNLKHVTVRIPLKKFVAVTGVSGSGKSTLVNDILAHALLQKFYHAKDIPGAHEAILGTEHLDKVVIVDQSPIGRTPRSNSATYVGFFAPIRELFARTPEARARGYKAGRFSFNVKGGRCEVCEGQGLKKIEMHFLPDVYIECEECHGKRYNKEALEVLYKGVTIADVLDMSVERARGLFKNIPQVHQRLETLEAVGLGYMKIGQPATTLSGGEAQRIKLATELSRRATGQTLYILDEPTTGLHFEDIRKLLGVLQRLVDKGNTVLVIEHNLDVIKCADWVIDLGPEGGAKGGAIVAEGTPRDIAKEKKSYTGQFLKKMLKVQVI